MCDENHTHTRTHTYTRASFSTINPGIVPWASYQIRKIVGCACAGMPGASSPQPISKKPLFSKAPHASRCMRHARALIHVGIAKPQWRRKRSRHSRRMRNHQFCVSAKRTMHWTTSFVIWSWSSLHRFDCIVHQKEFICILSRVCLKQGQCDWQ